jgi:glyoxalase-like protein
MMQFDHMAVGARTLSEARAHIEDALGVKMQPGGHHDVFATHNALLGLADGLYLEAIAPDPDAPPPVRPRWFDLDRWQGPARLSNWICRTDDLTGLLAQLPDSAGVPVALHRGDLAWDMAVPADGALPFENLHPALIRWRCEVHPATLLAPSGCALRRLVVSHPRGHALAAALAGPFSDSRVAFEVADVPALVAEFDTPHGVRVLA